MIKNKNIISENEIIFKHLKKLNFNKRETFNFKNDGAFLISKKNQDIVVTNDSIIEDVDFTDEATRGTVRDVLEMMGPSERLQLMMEL